MSRKSLLKSTNKKTVKPKETAGLKEAERKKAILEGVKRSPDSVKATLKELGLGQSTYYRWLQRYKAEGLDGLTTGGPVSDKVWKRFGGLQKKPQEQLAAASKLKAEEKQIMKSDKETRELLFRRFDEEPSKPATGKKPAAEPAKPKAPEEPLAPSYTPPPEDPMDKALKYTIGAFALVVAILVMASLSNSNKFYFKKNEQMIEMWRGRFAPMGEVRVASFSDPKVLEGLPEQSVYTKSQAFGAVSDYFIKQADKLLDKGRTPDLRGVKKYLMKASRFAVSDSTRQAVRMRLNSIKKVKGDLKPYFEEPAVGPPDKAR